MPNEPSPDDLKNLWQGQRPEPAAISLEEIRAKAGKFQRTIHWRNLREYAACVVVVVGYAFFFEWSRNTAMRVGSAMVIAAALYIVYHIFRHGSSKKAPADCAFESCVAFHRRELERQRDLLGGIWKWYLGPLIPGLVVFQAGVARNWTSFWIVMVSYALAAWVIGKVNRKAARKLDRQVAELNELEKA